jgi:hypothetical protein
VKYHIPKVVKHLKKKGHSEEVGGLVNKEGKFIVIHLVTVNN